MTIIAVQCRLSSSRLPQKALLTIDNTEIVRWTLRTLKKVQVDEYWLACDDDSFSVLSVIVREEGWQCFSGPKEDVLERFCLLAHKTNADIIIRATADNPYLFYEAAEQSLVEFKKRNCDYFTFSGLPHGSGVEVFSAKALLKAKERTSDAYDHEHVGPALYKYPELFDSVFCTAPLEWSVSNASTLPRTTVDDAKDYRRALRINEYLKHNGFTWPYRAKDILYALSNIHVQKPILFVPAVEAGRGTGHIRRVLRIVKNLKDIHGLCSDILLYQDMSNEVSKLVKNALEEGLISEKNSINSYTDLDEYSLIVTDSYILDDVIAPLLHSTAPVIAIDEGSPKTQDIDYLLDIIPSLSCSKNTNVFMPELLGLPASKPKKKLHIKKILISIGGEDPANFATCLFDSLTTLYATSDVTINSTKSRPIENLSEHIHEYDLVITHFGFTAFEAINAGCAVLLVATSSIHKKLSKKYNLTCIEKKHCSPEVLKKLVTNEKYVFSQTLYEIVKHCNDVSLESYILKLANGKRYDCPICGKQRQPHRVVSRDKNKTIRECSHCAMKYVSFCIEVEKDYSENYFFEEYKNQYGKTYLEDFESIKNQGLRRCKNILLCKKMAENANILDVGCAYGPFLSAAKDFGFEPFGSDISVDAVNYVKTSLGFSASVANFASPFVATEVFNAQLLKEGLFDAITMWFVIEHFQNLDAVLKNVSKNLKIGGVFAFSTPNGSGISKKAHKKQFYSQSPYDHFSIWEAQKVSKIVKKYGFRVKKIVITGIHKNRFPKLVSKTPNSIFMLLVQILKLGDTFEAYCVKEKDI